MHPSEASPAPDGETSRGPGRWPARRIAAWAAGLCATAVAVVLLSRVDWAALDADAIGPWAGFALVWTAVVAGATGCFLIARKLGRPVAQRFVSGDKLAAFDEKFAGRGMLATFLGVLAIRLFAHGSFDIVSYACGLIPFTLPLFLIASGIGVVPKAFAFTYLGASAGERPGWLDGLILVGTLGMLLLVPLWWRSRGRAGRPVPVGTASTPNDA